MKKIAVVAAHPDDEILGCGATISKYTSEGHRVTVIIAAQGLASRSKKNVSTTELKKLQKNCIEANQILGVEDIIFLNFPDNGMDTVPLLEIVQKLEEVFQKIKPDTVFTHHEYDLNIDHQLCHKAVLTACRPLPGSKIKEVFFFEVPSSTDWSFSGAQRKVFSPNYFENIEEHIKKKIQALKKYSSEMREFPHARSYEAVENLVKWRGCSVGLNAAEAFEVGRIIR